MRLQSGEVRVSTVSVDATQRRVDETVSTVSNGIQVDNSDMAQWNSRTQLGSGLPLGGGGGGHAVTVDCGTGVVGGLIGVWDFAHRVTSPGRFCW